MKTLFKNKYFQLIPEISILLLILLYWYSSTLLNPIAIILTTVIIFLIITKNKIAGIVLGSIILLLSLYLVLAYLSDIINQKADFKFIIFGALFIGIGILISTWLIVKYANLTQNNNFTIKKVNN